MKVYEIDGHQVNSSFDKETTETFLRSFIAMAQAFDLPEFENLVEYEQQRIVDDFYAKALPPPTPQKEDDFNLKDPILFEMDSGAKIVIHSSAGQWFVLLESEMLKF